MKRYQPGSPGPILVPAGWTADLDRKTFEVRYGPAEDCGLAAMKLLTEAYINFNFTLDRGLMSALSGMGEASANCGAALGASEKIDWLASLALSAEHRCGGARYVEILAFCSWIENERRRVLHSLRDPFSVAWAYQFVEIAECLHHAIQTLRDLFPESADGSDSGESTFSC